MKRVRGYLGFALILLASAFLISPARGVDETTRVAMDGTAVAKLDKGTESLHKEFPLLNLEDPLVKGLKAIHDRHTEGIMAMPETVGTAVGVDETGKSCILVLLKEEAPFGAIPASLEGVPVVSLVTGEIHAMLPSTFQPTARLTQTSKWPLPVPIGVSTGNRNECSAGTISARLKSGSAVYALSNNHVYARANAASIGEEVMQPGLYDTGCSTSTSRTSAIGTLQAFVPLDFTGGNNEVDAAIALSSTQKLGRSTPRGGYGTPSRTTTAAQVNLRVKKYGRTSSLTRGVISAINATVNVNYGTAGTARFVNQIIVTSRSSFIKPGDSGSLLVTDNSAARPVGLLFAGNSAGTLAVANPISSVLTKLGGAGVVGTPVSGLTIDGK